jgi:hypothetical protein
MVHEYGRGRRRLLGKLDSKLVTTLGNREWEDALVGIEIGKKSSLGIRCKHHNYKATKKPGWRCNTCWVLFVLKYQDHEDGERRLGSFNPYVYVIGEVSLEVACEDFEITR